MYHPDYINQKRKMVERYLKAGKFWIIKHIQNTYDDEAANLILIGLIEKYDTRVTLPKT